MKALVILSGGQDSTTCLAWAVKRYKHVEAITFFYNQKHKQEIDQSKIIADHFRVKHHIIDISFFSQIVDSALTSQGDVNKPHERLNHLPASFVPNRNAMFITIAHALAQKIGADRLVTGVCETDYSGYPDCRNVFIKNIKYSLNLGSDVEIEIDTPLMWLNKAQIWALADELGAFDIIRKHTLTCYNNSLKSNEWGFGCGICPACRLREAGYYKYIKESL